MAAVNLHFQPPSHSKRPDDKHIAHKLMVELLAHQFAFPVRWIETQDKLFSHDEEIRRLIEVGPGKVLVGMLKRTAEAKYHSIDLAHARDRKYLSISEDTKEICYEYTSPASLPAPEERHDKAPLILSPTPQIVQASQPKEPYNRDTPAAKIADAPPSATEVVCCLVAHKLRKAVDQVSKSKSIKELSAGKSTLQNELIGDLSNEFGYIPDGSEDLSLSVLGDNLEAHFSGKVGKQSSAIIAKFLSSKMPAGFNLISIREYLDQVWGIGPGRQTSVLLFATSSEPQSRLPTVDAAKTYFDGLIPRFASLCGLDLKSKTSNKNLTTDSPTLVDPAFLKVFRQEQKTLMQKQFHLYAGLLGIDPAQSSEIKKLNEYQQSLQKSLDVWYDELTEEFASGIVPCFDAKKTRRFNSAWNFAREEAMRLYYDAKNGRFPEWNATPGNTLLRFANRADPPLQLLAENLSRSLESIKNGDKNLLSFLGELTASLSSRRAISPVYIYSLPTKAPHTIVSAEGSIIYTERTRASHEGSQSFADLLQSRRVMNGDTENPSVHLRSRNKKGKWVYDSHMTKIFSKSIATVSISGLSFKGQNILITGAGPSSIGAEILRGLLMGGACVIVTTSRTPATAARFYQTLYRDSGAEGSELLLLPFNQGSSKDCEALIDHIYDESGLGRNLDAIIPFAAISESGYSLDEIGAKSELAHRLMLVNVIRLLGRIVRRKHSLGITTQPTQVILPLSPNHGTFGGDGLYSESKLGLESLLNRFRSEKWSEYLSICGASIGWTRSTGLMSQNDIVAEAIEAQGVLTFSAQEMACNILALMSPPIAQICDQEPILAQLDGGLQSMPDINGLISKTREVIAKKADLRKMIKQEDARQQVILAGSKASVSDRAELKQRSRLQIEFPPLPAEEHLKPLRYLQGMIEPSSTIVIVGFSELGPWGSSRTRWEFEHKGEFSQKGYIEMAWIMNLIKYFDGELNGQHYTGWVDVKTGEQIHDDEVGQKFGKEILEHSGIRFIEQTSCSGYDPSRKETLTEIAIEEDFPELDANSATAEAFKLRHGDNVTITPTSDPDICKVRFQRGAHLLVPKANPFSAAVAGQIPTGWDPVKYGITDDLVHQVDPVTLYTLCCGAEALYSAGIIDSFEIFRHIHPSEVGIFLGSSMGGTTKTRQMYRDQYLDKQVQSDIIQETYLNTPSAWLNMLLLGSAGPIKTPVGACATGIESLDIGCESILSGKTKLCFVGGTDNFQEDGCYAFSTMKATVNTTEEALRGREPIEMSRPTAESRAGFVEAQGCGIQILASAELALEMGLPIYGVVASSAMAADKIGRSVPAPGQGILSFAREGLDAASSPLLDLEYRRHRMEALIKSSLCNTGISEHSVRGSWTPCSSISESSHQLGDLKGDSETKLTSNSSRLVKHARRLWGHDFRNQNPNISPFRASLATWGLTVDDLDFVSLHGTSTKANDKNESDVINKEMQHLGRKPGHPLLAICQKSLTGHPKAPAAAWMLNGCLQALNSGIIPGNRNADNVDEELRKFEYLVFPTETIRTGELKAFLMSSFGFGQKGGQMIGIASKYFFASLESEHFAEYAGKLAKRKRVCNRAYAEAVILNNVVKAKGAPPYQPGDESKILLDPLARITGGLQDGFHYDGRNLHANSTQLKESEGHCSWALHEAADFSKNWVQRTSSGHARGPVTVGIDLEELGSFNSSNQVFLDRNYSDAEQKSASCSPNPHATLLGKWCAKEAVFKTLGVPSKGAAAPMKDIEILSEGLGPVVKLHGDAQTAARERKIQDIKVSITHSEKTVMAIALALRDGGEPSR